MTYVRFEGGYLSILGLGPGDPALVTPQTTEALAQADDLIGYGPYLARIEPGPGQTCHPTDNREELDRARHALRLAAGGRRVAIVSGGDPGVFAMASAVFEALEGAPEYGHVAIEVLPGVSAMFAVAARLGAPLGHDFCAISLSDNLKPWAVVLRRLCLAAEAGFVIALYNPASRARPWQLAAAFEALRPILPGSTPVVFATAVTRPDERLVTTTLALADAGFADMRTLVLIGSAATRRVGPYLYTPRSAC